MKIEPVAQEACLVTLQTVLDRLSRHRGLTPSRQRDLRSAVTSFAKLNDQPPAAIPLDLGAIRHSLDKIVPARAKISRKRWANLRSDLAAAIDAAGLRPMLKTTGIELDQTWRPLLAGPDQRIARALSRFAHWASLRQIAPQAVDDAVLDRFITELESSSLVRKLRYLRALVAKRWNDLAVCQPGVRPVTVRGQRVLKRVLWGQLPASFCDEVERYLLWASMPDPLADDARARALSPRTLRLQREHIHSAASAAVAAGMPIGRPTSLAMLVEPDMFRIVLRQLWQQDGRKLSTYTHGIAITLTAVAWEWVKAPAETITTLKTLRKRLGALPSGLTAKNQAFLLSVDDPRVLAGLVQLPDRLWHQARRLDSPYAFLALQTALAIDILIHAPARMQNLSAIKFGAHLHWPQGPRKPALLMFGRHETKTDVEFKHELPAFLADRLSVFRNEIAPAVIGRKPNTLFMTDKGKPRSQAAIAIGIHKAILRHLGVKMTPHQFRHLCAKVILDKNPGAYELVRQMLGHSSVKTTADFYAGVDTLRAGRAHADLINELRQSRLAVGRRRHRHAREQ